MNEQEKALIKAWSSHPREWENNTWVYPVISRRAGGLSLGVNLNPDHHCSFSCAYCQSGPQEGHKRIPVDIDAVEQELRAFLAYYASGEFAKCEAYKDVPEQNKLLKDICLSGDGESTIVKEFPEICRRMREIQKEYAPKLGDFKLRLITNASHIEAESVQLGLSQLLDDNGEIWAKLDAGSEEWFKKMNRSPLHLEKIIDNLKNAIKSYPLCIQTMLCNLQGEVPSEQEIERYIENLAAIHAASPSHLVEVQLYTVIRDTVLEGVEPLPKEFLESVKTKITDALPVKVRCF
jgi:wyosine [tRNA(Phe)-imidazoG37] synthetase (radical SAM superfamily)